MPSTGQFVNDRLQNAAIYQTDHRQLQRGQRYRRGLYSRREPVCVVLSLMF
jgi:hypothetical protein